MKEKKVKVKGEGEERKAKRLPIWKTAKHSTEVVSKVTLPHVVDAFTAQHLMADALPPCCGIVSLEVKYVLYPDFHDARELANQCWEDYIDRTHASIKKGGAK